LNEYNTIKQILGHDKYTNMKCWKTKSGYMIIRVLSGRSNVFLLTNGDKNILIDSSIKMLWGRLLHNLKKLGISSIDYLVLTHAHFDHVANAKRIKNKFRSKVVIQKEDADYLKVGENVMPKGTTLITRPLVKAFGKRFLNGFKYDPCKYDLLVDSRFDLKEFGFNAYLMHNPGHTGGSMSLIVDDEIAIVGDAMFGVFKRSVFPPFAVDVAQMFESWGKLLETNCSLFLPSHGSANERLLVEKEYKKIL